MVTAATLYAQHLADLQSGSTDLTQRVDDSLSVGLRQEGGVHQGTNVCRKHIDKDKQYCET